MFSGKPPRKVLIVSSHPLFGLGLRKLLQERPEADVSVVSIVSSVEEAVASINTVDPDLVVVDYDDERVNRDEFLARFVEGEKRLRVVLLSLKEGGSEAIVYDRRTMAASQIDDWLREWTFTKKPGKARWVNFQRMINSAEPQSTHRRTDMKHGIFAAIFVIVLTVLVTLGLDNARLLPVAASAQAGPIDFLFRFHFRAIAILFSLIVGLMVYSVIFFRRRPGDETDAPHIEGSPRLEVLWTLAPLAAVIYISILGANILDQIQRPAPKPLEVKVVSAQWSWRFEYPTLGITSTELVLPVNQQALLRLISNDVIHSFWVPEFRVKQDALPGGDNMIRTLRITPDLVGNYKVRCAELCGRLHSSMEAPVRVLSQADYDAWVAQEQAALSADPVVRGDKWSQQFGCRACHSIDGSIIVGPSWKGLYGHEVELEDGSKVVADDAYLLESIRDPGAKIVKGFQNIMPPTIADQMTPDQISDIIEFIKSLK